MLRNVIFDLGNVLISFKPSEYLESKKYPAKLKDTILKDVFGSREWQMLDDGKITIKEATDAITINSSLTRDEIAHIFDLRTEIIFPLTLNIKLLPELKKHGFKLYYLSNFPLDIFDEVRNGYFFFRYFDGGIISSEVKLSKPHAGIYNLLLKKYSLIPEECLYIDDIEINVISSESVGMKGFYTSGSPDISSEVRKILGLSLAQ